MDRRFVSSYCPFVGGNLVTWGSKNQLLLQVVLKLNSE